ncbi:MAG TPA: metalloregulator ArsR/SmtB family transcription factor [Acidimicrobiales bacterium]|nr:metalloregulator ArsR/SmtB family transcription factor [Acidimicrobiales bacterium]
MQVADTASPGPGAVLVYGPSLAADLSWVAFGASSPELLEKHPPIGAAYRSAPGLADRLRAFWGGDPATGHLACFPEFEVLVCLGDALGATVLDDVLAAVEGAIPSVPEDLRLASETEADRPVVRARLRALRTSPRRRRRYLELLAEAWAPVDPWWQAHGAASAGLVADDVRSRLGRGEPWPDLVADTTAALGVRVPAVVEAQQAGRPVALVVCAFFGKALFLDVPGFDLFGLGVGRPDVAARARTDQVARRLRALADPTRLAIVHLLGTGPRPVGEIARVFSLAQPTVSGHVKQLRDAGLVTTERRGVRSVVSVRADAVEALAGELATLLVP